MSISTFFADDEAHFAVRHQLDDMGAVFIGRQGVYRRISPQLRNVALELLKSDLLSELVIKGFFPRTEVLVSDGEPQELILRHDRAPFVLHAWEWSFSMLKDAALLILEVAQICDKHGYYLQDAHQFNVVYFGAKPLFVDFGSIRKGRRTHIVSVDEFLGSFYLPLVLWSEGEFYIANQVLSDERIGRRLLPSGGLTTSLLMGRYLKLLAKKRDLMWCVKRIANVAGLAVPWIKKPAYNLTEYGEMKGFNGDAMHNTLKAIPAPSVKTKWANYHDVISDGNETPWRFRRIIEVISKYSWNTAVDVAGNGGYFAEIVVRHFAHAHVLCLDYDSQAVERCYQRCLRNPDVSGRLTPGMMNIMYPVDKVLGLGVRVGADMVFALAVTHHLLLVQNADIDVLIADLLRISRKYMVIEFMPLGLWDGNTAPPLPSWYTCEWFRQHLRMQCVLLWEEKTEDNRIMFMCEKVDQ